MYLAEDKANFIL